MWSTGAAEANSDIRNCFSTAGAMPPKSVRDAPISPGTLPKELAEFLSRQTYSLLIKGESGTGKTVLALSLLKAVGPLKNVLYISTRFSPFQLLESYPWAEGIFRVSRGDQAEQSGLETMVDARLDEPNFIFERITNVLMDEEAPTVLLDSWESMSDTVGSEALKTNIRVLQTWRERAGARFIFIGEDPSNSVLDYLVEGVVVLRQHVADGKRLREIGLSKLHGVRISRPSYFFTLDGGSFRSFPGYDLKDYEFRNPPPIRHGRPLRRPKERYPTGHTHLDALLGGGYPRGSTVSLELDARVDARVALVFLDGVIQNWLEAEDRLVLQLPPGTDRRFVKRYVGRLERGRGRRLVSVVNGYEEGTDRSGRSSTGHGSLAGRPVLRVVCPSRARGDEPEDGYQTRKSDLTIQVVREGDGMKSGARSAVWLKLADIEGTLFLESLSPWSTTYAVVPVMTAGNPQMQLFPVV